MEPIKPLGNVGLIPYLQCSPQSYQVSKECHLLTDAGTSGNLEDLKMREIDLNLQVLQTNPMGNTWLGSWL